MIGDSQRSRRPQALVFGSIALGVVAIVGEILGFFVFYVPTFWLTALALACPLMLIAATFGCLLFAFSARLNATAGNGLRTTALVVGILYLICSLIVGLLTAFVVLLGSGSGGPL